MNTYLDYQDRIDVALGNKKADLVLKNAYIIDVFTKSIYQNDIAILNGIIVGIGTYHADNEIDLTNKYICPGLIDAHLHIESSLVKPEEFINIASLEATTTFIIDPHEAMNVSGVDGLEFMLKQTSNVQADVFFMLPSCIPSNKNEDNNAIFKSEDMIDYLDNNRIIGLGEAMGYQSILTKQEDMYNKIALFENKIIDGHAPGINNKQLCAYLNASIKTDHECETYDEVINKLRLGMHVLIREGSAAKNLDQIITKVIENKLDCTNLSFCTDDKHIHEIKEKGHISYHIRRSIELGLDPITAIQMASINTARLYNLKNVGAIAVGYLANLVILDDLNSFKINKVYYKGKEIKEKDDFSLEIEESLLDTVHFNVCSIDDLKIKIKDKLSPIIKINDNSLITSKLLEHVNSKDGIFISDNIYNKLVCIERHKKTNKQSNAIVKGFNLENAAIATSVSHDSHNITVVGSDDENILVALNKIKEIKGGYVLVKNKKVYESLALPIMGLMSNLDSITVSNKLNNMNKEIKNIGYNLNSSAFMILSFISLTAIPEIRLTTSGIYDTIKEEYIR